METTQATSVEPTTRRLERPEQRRVLGGVAAALADHTGSSVGLIRLAFLVAALFGGLGVVIYLAAWALIPAAGSTASAAELWMGNLTTPGKRVGAFLIGIAGLVIIAGAAPVTIVAAAALLAGAALLADNSTAQRSAVAPMTADDTPETRTEQP